MRSDDATALILGIASMAAFTIVLGISLVPVWEPEVIPVLAGAAALLMLVAQIVAIRNAFRRGELFWIIPIVILGPVGPLAYGLIKATESGELSYYLDTLSQSIVGEQEPEEQIEIGRETTESVEIAIEEIKKSLPSRQTILTGTLLLTGLLSIMVRLVNWIYRNNRSNRFNF